MLANKDFRNWGKREKKFIGLVLGVFCKKESQKKIIDKVHLF